VIKNAQAREATNGRRVVRLLSELGVPSALVDWIVACAESLESSNIHPICLMGCPEAAGRMLEYRPRCLRTRTKRKQTTRPAQSPVCNLKIKQHSYQATFLPAVKFPDSTDVKFPDSTTDFAAMPTASSSGGAQVWRRWERAVYMCTYLYIYVCVCVYMCIYIYVYILYMYTCLCLC
jgi:hypothetical protein